MIEILGGSLIGGAAVWLYLALGRIAGISGIATQALLRSRENLWPLMFIVGLGVGGWLAYFFVGPRAFPPFDQSQLMPLLFGGLLVGFGTRLGSGCTSGHGVCGIARFSMRSLVATTTFLIIGIITATGLALL